MVEFENHGIALSAIGARVRQKVVVDVFHTLIDLLIRAFPG
ncbi:MAG: hypothetical protein ACLGIB_09715 [Actinomycetota bacterium]